MQLESTQYECQMLAVYSFYFYHNLLFIIKTDNRENI